MKELFLAALKIDGPIDIGYEGGSKNVGTAVMDMANLAYMWAGVVAVVVLVVAGFLFVTARGDPTQMKRAKDAIRGAVIGLIVIMVAFTITQFILGRVQQ